MKKIEMVDLKNQYQKCKTDIDNAIEEVINQTSFIKGPAVKQFEKDLGKYLNSKHVIGCANGTDALQIALMSLDLQPGDEIISPNFTFISTVEVSAVLGLKPVLVDVLPDTYTIDPNAIEKAITPRTRAIVPVHLYGQSANMNEIMRIAEKHNLYVIEDNAQAIGASFKYNDSWVKTGTIAHIGCTSFFPSKNLGCYGDGGAVNTNNDELAGKIRAISNHGMQEKYYNDYVGINSRLDTLQAAILGVKLKKLDAYNTARQKLAKEYDRAFKDISYLSIPQRIANSTHVFHQYTIQLNKNVDREHFRNYLQQHEIPSMIYYPIPMHQQKAYAYLNNNDADFSVSISLCKKVISLPMHTEMEDDQKEYIIQTINDYQTLL